MRPGLAAGLCVCDAASRIAQPDFQGLALHRILRFGDLELEPLLALLEVAVEVGDAGRLHDLRREVHVVGGQALDVEPGIARVPEAVADLARHEGVVAAQHDLAVCHPLPDLDLEGDDQRDEALHPVRDDLVPQDVLRAAEQAHLGVLENAHETTVRPAAFDPGRRDLDAHLDGPLALSPLR